MELFNYTQKFQHNKLAAETHQSSKLQKFIRGKQLGPDCICFCCQGLFFPYSLRQVNKTEFFVEIFKHIPTSKILKKDRRAFLKEIDNYESDTICTTCHRDVKNGNVPKFAANENLRYPDIPQCLTNLSSLSIRMISPYLNFMQIRELMRFSLNSQLAIKGSVVNIPVEIPEMVKELPRSFDQSQVIQIVLKRAKHHKTYYKAETISPAQICEALLYLKDQPLYKKHGIHINSEFFEKYNNNYTVKIDFVLDDEIADAVTTTEPTNSIQDGSEFEDGIQENSDDEDNPDKVIDEEIMLTDHSNALINQLSTTNDAFSPDSITIAPGEGKTPVPSYLIEDIDELSFPNIYGGQPMDETKKLTYAARIKYELRHHERRACIPERLFHMVKRKQELEVHSAISIALRKHKKNTNLTASDVNNSQIMNDIIQRDEGYKFLQQQRSSPAFWEWKKKN